MLKVEKDILLSGYTTLGVGGPADYLAVVRNSWELTEALDWATANNQTFLILGGGSNVLISDSGFRGVVIINRANHYEITNSIVTAESGTMFSKLARDTLATGNLGLHFGSGIPGTVGGAAVGNAGALGFDISESLVSAEVWGEGHVETWGKADFGFGYRSSRLKNNFDYVVLSIKFQLKKGNVEEALSIIQDDKKRRAGSYLGRTCGSYFQNPVGDSAGKLIDSLGLRSYRLGGAEVSPLHANVIRNIDHAKAVDILALEEHIQNNVYKKYHLRLEPEVVKIGF